MFNPFLFFKRYRRICCLIQSIYFSLCLSQQASWSKSLSENVGVVISIKKRLFYNEATINDRCTVASVRLLTSDKFYLRLLLTLLNWFADLFLNCDTSRIFVFI
jgi:hypothetical protein